MRRRRSPVEKPSRSVSSDALQAADECEQCALWEVRHQVAIRATYYLSLYISELSLRKAVLEHITGAWAQRVRNGCAPGEFQAFFDAYRADVECGVNLALCKAGYLTSEYRRVWTNHALVLRGELDRITPRVEVTDMLRMPTPVRRSRGT